VLGGEGPPRPGDPGEAGCPPRTIPATDQAGRRKPAYGKPALATRLRKTRLTANLLLADKPRFEGKPTFASGQGQEVAAGRRLQDRKRE